MDFKYVIHKGKGDNLRIETYESKDRYQNELYVDENELNLFEGMFPELGLVDNDLVVLAYLANRGDKTDFIYNYDIDYVEDLDRFVDTWLKNVENSSYGIGRSYLNGESFFNDRQTIFRGAKFSTLS
jgi:hypothetical protein